MKPTKLGNFGSWVVRRTSQLENGATLAVCRVLVALSTLELVLPLLLTSAGRQTVIFAFCDVAYGGYRPLPGSWFLLLWGGARPEVVFSLLGAAAISSLLLLVGLFGRLPALICAICTRSVFTQNVDVSGSGDALLGVALLLLVLGDSTATLSLDCRLRSRRWLDDTPIAAWPRQLGLFHLTVVYVVTGLQKLISTAWTPVDDFSALYQILQSPHWARWPELVPSSHGLATVPLAIASATTIAFELSFWLIFLSKRLRVALAVLGVGLHVGIALLMEVGAFSWISLSLYPLLFPELWPRILDRLRKPGPTAAGLGTDVGTS